MGSFSKKTYRQPCKTSQYCRSALVGMKATKCNQSLWTSAVKGSRARARSPAGGPQFFGLGKSDWTFSDE